MVSPVVRPARESDLASINAIIEAAVMGWSLPERVKRLSVDSYRYTLEDLRHFAMRVALDGDRVVGVAAFEQAARRETPNGVSGLMLHGLYVDPAAQRRGVGRVLVESVASAARYAGHRGVLVKASRDAVDFFRRLGFARVAASGASDYPNLFWLPIDGDGDDGA